MRPVLFALLTFLIPASLLAQPGKKNPSFEEIISLRSVGNPQLSPDGQHVVFSQNSVDWKENRYDSELWLSRNGEAPFQLTNHPTQSSYGARWSPDGKWIAFLTQASDKSQIHVMRLAGGTSFPVSATQRNISAFEWSPDGKQIAFLQSEDKEAVEKQRADKYGAFAIEDAEYSLNELWVMDFVPERLNERLLPVQMKDSAFQAQRKARPLLDSLNFTITRFQWSPDGSKIAFTHQPTPLINSFLESDISVYDLASDTYALLVSNQSNDDFAAWSPDGKSILYETSLDDNTSNFFRNNKVFRIDLDGSRTEQLAKKFDENLGQLAWTPAGIFGIAWQKTERKLVQIDPQNGKYLILSELPPRIGDFDFSRDGRQVAFSGVGDKDLLEIYLSDFPLRQTKVITDVSRQIDDWLVANSEVISWKSEDGTTIEGVLHKPQNYDPNQKYPLLVIIHGGPTGVSTPEPTPSYVYPMVQWLNKGALILRPNYRGSAGYGEAFRSLNVQNLGVGDAWDVLSGVNHLVKAGLVDQDKVGAMGWSQGGYISAFLTTNSDRFQAISVGAGISNWMTYYVNTDIHPFTRQYLKATPWSDKEIYEKTSPMTHINQATTPTLIQHGEFDRRVPTANAFELYQGLQDVGVETELIIYKGFGHGINKPRERLAAMWHNWQWFGKYIWGEEIEMPKE